MDTRKMPPHDNLGGPCKGAAEPGYVTVTLDGDWHCNYCGTVRPAPKTVSATVSEIMRKYQPSNEGGGFASGTWRDELVEQLLDPESNRILVRLLRELRTDGQEVPVLLDPHLGLVHDGHSRILAAAILDPNFVLEYQEADAS